jgi:hypothetical protein
MVFGLTEVNPRYFALETSILTKHNMKRVSRYLHSWLDNTYNKMLVALVRGFSVIWGIWNINIGILYLSAPTYLYHFLNIGASVLMIVEYWLIELLLLNANSAIFQLYHGENKLNFQWYDDDVHFALDQHADLELHSHRSLK